MGLTTSDIKQNVVKRSKTFYISEEDIALVKREAARLGVSQNAVISALIAAHRRNLTAGTKGAK